MGDGSAPTRRLTRRDLLLTLGIGLVAVLAMLPYWGSPPHYDDPDALFYQAQSEEIRGASRQEALDDVFSSPLADDAKQAESYLPAAERRVSDPEWVEYSSRFYRRRWALPVAAAAVNPVLGTDSLEALSLAFYVAATMLLYLLLRLRFGQLVSGAVALSTLLLPPLRLIAHDGLTDSLGLALLIAALIFAVLTLDRGRRWLWPWVAAVLLLSVTRDLTLVLVIASTWVALRLRTRTAYALAGTGLLASLPAPMLAGAPFRENLAYVINGYYVPTDTSWGYVLGHYPAQLWDTIWHDFHYPLEFAFPPAILAELAVIGAGILALALIRSHGDPFIQLMRAALLGGVLTIMITVNFTAWRLELAMLPPVAVGVALLAERLVAHLAGLREQRPESRAPALT